MFFSINTQGNDERFPENHIHGGFYIGLDLGWQHKFINDVLIFYKGYCDTNSVENILEDFLVDPTPAYTGNFGIIIVRNKSLVVTHDLWRSFPLYYNATNNLLGNLPDNNSEKIFADEYVEINNNTLTKTKFKWLPDVANPTNITKEIADILIEKTIALNSQSNIKVFLSGGLNTMLCYGLLKKFINKENFELINHEYMLYDYFLSYNFDSIKNNFRFYRQIHHWELPTILVSGSCGDEYFLRGPGTVAIWAAWHDINIIDECEKFPNGYQTSYYLEEKNKKIFNEVWNTRENLKTIYKTKHELNRQILNMLSNDHQHWHLGNTQTWTPFRDLRIPAMLLQLPQDILLTQILHTQIENKLIEIFDQNLLNYISDRKNKNTFRKLTRINE